MSGGYLNYSLNEEFKKNTGIKPKDIAEFRKWLANQPHLPAEHITDLDLILAYHCCDRSTEVAKQTLDLHYTLKTLFTTIFKDTFFDSEVEKCMNTVLYKPLPMRTKEGCAILYAQLLDTNLQAFNLRGIIRSLMMVLDLWQHQEGTWPGLVIVSNLSGFTLGHAARMDFGLMQQLLYFVQEAMLLNLESVVIINSPPVFDKVLTMLKPLMKNSLIQKLHICRGIKGAEDFFPIEALPFEAGGQHISIEACKEEMIEEFRRNKEFFEIENKKRVNEMERPGKPKSISDIFGGVEGSFKKLEID